MSRAGRECFRRVMAGTSSGPGGGAGVRERINFLTGIALASPLSSPQQPVGKVWYRGLAHQKPDGRSPPRLIIAPAVSAAPGGTSVSDRLFLPPPEERIPRPFGSTRCFRFLPEG